MKNDLKQLYAMLQNEMKKLRGSQTKVFYEKIFQYVNKFQKDIDVLDSGCKKSKWVSNKCKTQFDKTNDKLVIAVPNFGNEMNARAAEK